MLGGIALLLLLVLIANAISEYGFEALFRAVVRGLKEGGKTIEEIKKEITSYWFISRDLKLKLNEYLDSFGAA
ncbi:MAG TPA: hypothetical protein VHD56_13570 [Tepidisphaeraceae bacterium]|nr:hypothetical protein [Tepidisphaeraceae bacterium]